MMAIAALFSIAFSIAGLWLSWVFDLASGATIILVASVVFLFNAFLNLRRDGRTAS